MTVDVANVYLFYSSGTMEMCTDPSLKSVITGLC